MLGLAAASSRGLGVASTRFGNYSLRPFAGKLAGTLNNAARRVKIGWSYRPGFGESFRIGFRYRGKNMHIPILGGRSGV